MKVDYSGKTVVITGGAGAIGSAMAEAFAANGAKVAVCGRNVAKGQEVADKIKAAGGIRTRKDMEKFIYLGADRLGTSSAIKILKNEKTSGY